MRILKDFMICWLLMFVIYHFIMTPGTVRNDLLLSTIGGFGLSDLSIIFLKNNTI